MTQRLFPILWGYEIKERIAELRAAGVVFLPIGLPFEMIAPHDARARSNHGGQTLVRLAERGGLSPCEALAVLDDRGWNKMPQVESCTELCTRIIKWTTENRK